jgi:cyclopropane fatty-acyl-phospholipid synthase-like methyltransferase
MEEKLAEALDLCPGAQVLDAGCGVGHVAIQMARKYGLRVKGIDVVDHHVAKAKRNIVAAGLSDGEVTCEKMDYHNLKHIKSESLDGIYTIETFVHATDPEGVLAGFFDLLKPGGRIAMFEYENRSGDQSSQGFFNVEISRGLEWINKHSAMHTNMSSFPGEYKKMLEGVGFDHVEIRDYSDNIRPMTRFFCLLAFVPFLFIRLFGLEKYFINTVAGVGSYIGSAHWGYMAISASKPAKLDGGK